VRIFIIDDLPGLEEAIKKIFPEADRKLCVLHAVRDAFNKVWKKDREAPAEALKKIYRAESREEAEKPLRSLRERGARPIPRSWSGGKPGLMPFLRFYVILSPSEGISIPPTSWSGWPKRRTKVVEVFCDEGAVENLLYLVLSQLDEAWGARRLRGFAEIRIGNYHVAFTQ